jgi:hypothetical protein
VIAGGIEISNLSVHYERDRRLRGYDETLWGVVSDSRME